MDKYEKKYDSAVSETETDIRKLTDLLLKVGTQQFLEKFLFLISAMMQRRS